jgi:DNA-binding response OmpR family regulator
MLERQTLRILVVDDDPAICRLIEQILTAAGFSAPLAVRTGREALTRSDNVDVVLLDHRLPDLKGLDLVPALRARPNRPSVVLVTAHGNESLAANALRLGADDYLIKDHSLAEMLPQVLERVRRARALREALAAAERDLVHAERRAAIGQLSVSLHHSINNPLMSASAEVDLLLSKGQSLGEDQRQSLSTVKQALSRINEIMERARHLKHDATEEYLDGIRMIDLSRRTTQAPVFRGSAVLYVPDNDTAKVLDLLLRHAGFGVQRVENVDQLFGVANRDDVVLVVLTALAAKGTDPLGGFKPAPNRSYTLVALVQGDGQPARAAGADLVVTLPFDPGTFVSDLLEAMKR